MPDTQFAYRSNAGFCIANGPPSDSAAAEYTDVKQSIYSPCGRYIALLQTSSLAVLNTQNSSPVAEIPVQNVLDFEFSPLGTYVAVLVRYNKPAGDQRPPNNLTVFEVSTGSVCIEFSQKNQSGWNVQYTSDESLLCRLVSNQVHCYKVADISTGIAYRLNLESMSSFSIAPGNRHVLAAFVSEKKGSPACVKLYDISNFNVVLSQKAFYRADSVQYYWNATGTNLLAFAHTEVDATGKSYYGETNLYYLSVSGTFDCRVDLDRAGPIHDIAWSPNGKEFIVVYGTMPAKSTLFDHRASPMFELGNAARNQIRFNNTGRLFFIAGFGNLAGDMDVWDRKTFKKVITMQLSNPSSCEWGPDGRHFMATTLYKRLKVDNGIKIYHYSGVLVKQIDVKEMHQSFWRPEPESNALWPDRQSLSPPPSGLMPAKPVTVAGKYRPPGARDGSVGIVYVI